MPAQLWTLHGLSVELHCDRRTLRRDLSGLEPDGGTAKSPRWLMHRVVAHLLQLRSPEALDLNLERARLAAEQADHHALRNAVSRRELVRVEDVRELWTGVLSETRAHMLALPSQCAPLVLGLETIVESQEVLDRHVRDALSGLARAGDGVPIGDGPAVEADGERVGRPAPPAKRRGKRGAGAVAH